MFIFIFITLLVKWMCPLNKKKKIRRRRRSCNIVFE